MASWHNLNFASQGIADNIHTIPPPLLSPTQQYLMPPPSTLPPMLGCPPSILTPPFPPPSLPMGFPCQSYNIPPPCNPNIPPPSILMFPPPIPGLLGNNCSTSGQTEDKFETLKENLKIKHGHVTASDVKVSAKIKVSFLINGNLNFLPR